MLVGYWLPYRLCHGNLVAGNATAVAVTLLQYLQSSLLQRTPATQNVAIFFGDDFEWSDALIVYPTLDRVLQLLSTSSLVQQVLGPGVRLTAQYSTPSRYLTALARDSGPQSASSAGAASGAPATVPGGRALRAARGSSTERQHDASATVSAAPAFPYRPSWDFMPHGYEVDEVGALRVSSVFCVTLQRPPVSLTAAHRLLAAQFPWWTGFYTSRPEFKQKFHAASSVLRAVSQLHSFARDASAWLAQFAALRVLWEGVSMVQHHDAMTSDAHDFVMDDWLFNYIMPGLANASGVATAAVAGMGGPAAAAPCLNASYIPCASVASALAAGKPVTLTVHNPLAWARDEVVDMLVPVATLAVVDAASSTQAQGQVSPAVAEDVDASGLPPSTWYMLSFVAADIPPLGWRTFTITPASTSDSTRAAAALPLVAPVVPNGPFVIANGNASASFDASGNLLSITAGGAAIDATASLLYYSSQGERAH